MEKGMISVDQWSEDSQAYFLTHLHADHTKGLSSKWNKGYLFCSPITSKLFPSKFPDFKFSLLRVLEIGETYSISVVSPSSGSRIEVQVTAIDANHCPGAVMYLFRGEFGCMLYTGDFRWEGISERSLLGKNMLLNVLGNDKIDIVYLDNTYCNPSYTFPPREVVAQQVIDIIKSHPEHDVVIAVNTLGKEDLLLRIAKSLKAKIWVWPERLETMHILGYQDTFTTNTSLTRIRAIPFYSFRANTLEGLNTIHPTIGIMPSGLPWMVRNTNDTVFNQDIYVVPYSDHSCFEELQAFMKLFKPVKVEGIVSSSSCYIEPDHYLGHFCEVGKVNEEASERVEMKKRMVKSAIASISLSRKRWRCCKFGKFCERRVSVLRRVRRGAKIVETVEND